MPISSLGGSVLVLNDSRGFMVAPKWFCGDSKLVLIWLIPMCRVGASIWFCSGLSGLLGSSVVVLGGLHGSKGFYGYSKAVLWWFQVGSSLVDARSWSRWFQVVLQWF